MEKRMKKEKGQTTGDGKQEKSADHLPHSCELGAISVI